MNWVNLFFSAQGRTGRRDFWIGAAILFVAGILINVLPGLGQLIFLGVIYCWVCLYAKRLHDADRSGWLVMVPILVWFGAIVVALIVGGLGLVTAFANSQDEGTAAAALFAGLGSSLLVLGLAGLFNIAFLLWVGLSEPTPGPNRYGDSAGEPLPTQTDG
jgi:uncharacterized membrane protein YhaH (DUF805 family)